ncbi:hypothetical protein F4678DRAFT_474942 [Xylaria arbuscula]|nr:hypothetical protein F4678DRAFT_474942 [Xylaria arbuscula]
MAVINGRNLILGRSLSKSSILYSQIVRRPLSRALPRIPRRSSIWPCDNLDAGRGAKTTFSFVSTAVTDETYISHSSPRTHKTHTPKTTSKIPFATRTISVETSERDTIMQTWNSIRNDTSHDSADTNSSQPIGASIERLIKHGLRKSSKRVVENVDFDHKVPLSNRVHIIGFGMHARYLAHALTSTPDVPVNILVHHPKPVRQWGIEGRELSLYDSRGVLVSSSRVACPRHISDYRDRQDKPPQSSDYLDNIIIDTTSSAILPSLYGLSHLIDRQTTICLLQPGLGLMERINEVLFPDPLERPNYMSNTLYSIKDKRPGALYLHWVPKFTDPALANSPIAYEGLQKTQHLINLFLPEPHFMTWKLPWLIFSSAADTICVILGCKYSQIHPNPHAMEMWEDILAESVNIVSQLPELQETPRRGEHYTVPSFRRKMRTYLVRLGMDLPIDYFNGYLVKRAKELGLNHKYNSMATRMVKARVNARQWELSRDLLGTSQYMTDTDTIGGGQPAPDLEDFVPDDNLE